MVHQRARPLRRVDCHFPLEPSPGLFYEAAQSCQPISRTPGPGLVGWSPTLRTPGLQMLVGWSRTLRTHIVYYTHTRFYTAALSLYAASTEAIAAFAVALALSAMGS